MRGTLFFATCFLLLMPAAKSIEAAPEEGYRDPPAPIADILDAPRTPAVSFSPDRSFLLELERPVLRPLAELAEPRVKVAGLKIHPRTNGPAREYAYRGITVRKVGDVSKNVSTPLALPDGARVRNMEWHDDSEAFAFTVTVEGGIELWRGSVNSAEPERLTGPVLNAAYGAPCDWLPGAGGLICKAVPKDRGAPPQASPVPAGPHIEENMGRKAPARTYTNLLQNPHDEALFEHYLASEVLHVGLDGSSKILLNSSLVDEVTPSPDGSWLLIKTIEPPFSYHVPVGRFPRRIFALEIATGRQVDIENLALADQVPIAFGSVRTGRRTVSWRADQPATLWWVEALDGGDAGAEAEHRDALYTQVAPFDGAPRLLWKSQLRFSSIRWGRDDTALVSEWWYNTRALRTWRIDPSGAREPKIIWDRSYQDRYSDPGNPLSRPGPYGWWVLRMDGDRILTAGRGASPDGVYPFLDRVDLQTGRSERLWRAKDPYFESVQTVLDDAGKRFISRRQSKDEPPNYFLRRTKGDKVIAPVTAFVDPAPQFDNVQKEVITYERDDGLELSATLYLPPGYEPERDGPRPTVFWVYPNEFKSRGDAGQVTASPNTFSRPGGSSVLFLLLRGYVVVSDPKIPIVGEGDVEPNDSYVEQLQSGARAIVDYVVDRGVSDPDRLIIGGHSYGAFTAANLLAHTDLFVAGIARSGAYNRSLTPFGFQGEQRNYWEAVDTYLRVSPFTHAHKIDEPLLLIHGAEDPNSGTYPMQTERLYEALKGLGGKVRWVELPLEEHGYRARESVGHTLWEMIRWCDLHTGGVPEIP